MWPNAVRNFKIQSKRDLGCFSLRLGEISVTAQDLFFYYLIVTSVKGQAAEVPVEQQKAPGATYGTEIPYKVRIP